MKMMFGAAIVALTAATVFAGAALAGPVVANGGFETITGGGATNNNLTGGPYHGQTQVGLTGWTNSDSYSFVSNGAYNPNANAAGVGGSTGGVNIGQDGANNPLILYGPAGGLSSPTSGNFVAADGDMSRNGRGYLYQTITGLNAGDNYAISFYQAAAEQNASKNGVVYSSPTTEQWSVGFGSTLGSGASQTSTLMNTAAQSYTGWSLQTLVFNAGGASEVLSFFALGNPAGSPPFVLLDGVTIADVPEPASWAVLALGLAGMLLLYHRRAAMA